MVPFPSSLKSNASSLATTIPTGRPPNIAAIRDKTGHKIFILAQRFAGQNDELPLLPHHRIECAAFSFRYSASRLAIVNHKRVVFSHVRPGTARHFAKIDKLPIGHIRLL